MHSGICRFILPSAQYTWHAIAREIFWNLILWVPVFIVMTQFSFAACPLCQFKIKRSKQRLISVFEGQKFRSSLKVVKRTTTNYIVNIIGPIARIQCLINDFCSYILSFFFPAVTPLCVCMCLSVRVWQTDDCGSISVQQLAIIVAEV